MPRYFFNIFDGHSSPDIDGTSLPDREAARHEAIRLAGHVLRDEAERLIPDENWSMDVTDVEGSVLFRLNVCLTEAPAVRGLVSASG